MNRSLNRSVGGSTQFTEAENALRRIAVLVARGTTQTEIFDAVATELGHLVHADAAHITRYEHDGTATVVAAWSPHGTMLPVGTNGPLEGRSVAALVSRSGRSAKMDTYADAPGPLAGIMREHGAQSTVGAPIVVEGGLWGVVTATAIMKGDESWASRAEPRLAAYTELIAIAIANAQARADLAASRARVVFAADQARRRIERDLHDGIQQRLLALALEVREAQATVPYRMSELRKRLSAMTSGLTGVLVALREISRGIHPAILSEGGLRPALRGLARRCPVAAELQIDLDGRLPEPVEAAAYYVVAEAVANVVKHAHASVIRIHAAVGDGRLTLSVADDGIGGAVSARGSGLSGLGDRVDALGGTITISSPDGQGTNLRVGLPLKYCR